MADQVGGAFKLALVLTHETGHRIGAIQQLKWSDVDFGSGNVKWRAEVDKIRYEHVTSLTPAAMEALRAARNARKAIGDGWIVPSTVDTAKAASRHLLRDWWQRAQELATLPPEPGRRWHSLRRKFATELKHTPLKDLCALGGWKSPQTILLCYQRSDPVTMRVALATRMRLEG